MITLSLFLAGLTVMLVSLSGVLFTRGVFGTWMRSHISILTSFATGVVAMLAYHLATESIHELPYLSIVFTASAGFLLLELVHRLFPGHDNCTPHHDHSLDTSHAHTPIHGTRVLLSDGIHNISDGFVLVAGFLVSIPVGIATTIAVLFHEVVQEIAEFFILKEAGYSDREALTMNFAVSATIFLGIIIGLLFAQFSLLIPFLGAFALGCICAVLARDLGPHVYSALKHESIWRHTLALCAGFVLMATVTLATPHEEAHSEVESDHVSITY